MTNRIKEININIDKIVSHRIKNKEHFIYSYFKNIIKPESNIIDVYNEDLNLIKNFSSLLNKEAFFISFFLGSAEAIKTRKMIQKKNVMVLNSLFSNNDIKSFFADILIAKNLFTRNNNIEIFKEINRVLKENGHFYIKEYLTINQIKKFANKQLIKNNENPFCFIFDYFQNIIKYLKNIEYSVEISGYSNFIFISKGNINKLNEFCSFTYEKLLKNNDLEIKDLTVTFYGKKRD